jgi:hypothetical protein
MRPKNLSLQGVKLEAKELKEKFLESLPAEMMTFVAMEKKSEDAFPKLLQKAIDFEQKLERTKSKGKAAEEVFAALLRRAAVAAQAHNGYNLIPVLCEKAYGDGKINWRTILTCEEGSEHD